VYAPARSSKGIETFPGLAVGGELGWGDLPQPFGIAESHYKYVVFSDLNWDFRTLDFDRDLVKADRIDAEVGQFNATDPDLRAFRQRGGKLLQYHGWNDQQIAPQNSINYYNSVGTRMGNGRPTEDFYRLFMVPGMMHQHGRCRQFRVQDALTVVKGERLIRSRLRVRDEYRLTPHAADGAWYVKAPRLMRNI
jgi:feruloyl esterase